MLHDAIAAIAYAGSRLTARAVPAAVGTLAAHSGRSSVDAYADTPRGHFTVSALNGSGATGSPTNAPRSHR